MVAGVLQRTQGKGTFVHDRYARDRVISECRLGVVFNNEASLADFYHGQILEGARQSDLLVANADDPRVMAHSARFEGRTLTFGLSEGADVRATAVQHRGLDGVAATVTTPHGQVRVSTPLLGLGNLSNVLAAAAVASELGVSLDTIAERAASMRPAAHRGALLRLPGGITLID